MSGRQLCLPHRLKDFLSQRAYACRLWTSSAHTVLASIRQVLASLKVNSPAEYTFKMFRAGHATALAEEGKSLGHILKAGEWKSSAVLSYIDEDAGDAAQFLDSVLDDSDAD